VEIGLQPVFKRFDLFIATLPETFRTGLQTPSRVNASNGVVITGFSMNGNMPLSHHGFKWRIAATNQIPVTLL
jgi:hypothetical protein